MRALILVLGLMGTNGYAREATMRETLLGSTLQCGKVKIVIGPDGRAPKYDVNGRTGTFRTKWAEQTATLSFEEPRAGEGPFTLRWAANGSGLLYLDKEQCTYL